ncbi:MAG: gliding motility lipoprotein GldD [Bacteroidetes bacterium]|nr:MAG: gliding motility lipoprotein GldD [Bacteroidota bacterium]MBL1143935.1 gliding motility lipoprotein GldD [Bacteroidota bacterium]MCB0802374.1 gliding motility lipoprotein GldD [Flavobacteriales bacterium]NOG56736.1 gliding motility lipoprotein GldD [Bacteroidota bacterium]
MKKLVPILFTLAVFFSCNDNYLPKPTGYFRIDLPEKNYQVIDTLPFPFEFELPQYAYSNLQRTAKDSNFMNIDFTKYNARVHLSYIPIHNNIGELLEDARTLVYKHVSKAQDIKENLVFNQEERVFGTFYEIAGNAASGSQFYITDSLNHFVRGALYFNAEPNFDSIAPVQDFLIADIEHFLESFKWVNQRTH